VVQLLSLHLQRKNNNNNNTIAHSALTALNETEQIVCSQNQRKSIIVALGWCVRDNETLKEKITAMYSNLFFADSWTIIEKHNSSMLKRPA